MRHLREKETVPMVPNKTRRLEDRVPDTRSVIAPGTSFKGNISGPHGVFVAGNLEGDIKSGQMVWIAESGEVRGSIQAPYVIVEGRLRGNIRSAQHVELRESSVMNGDIETLQLAVAEGSVYQGKVVMSGGQNQATPFKEKRAS